MKTVTLNVIAKLLTLLGDVSPRLLPVLQVFAVIIGLSVIGLMIWKGKP